ncbi:hypothetical protein [Paraliobacillus sp. JSM ZJ581]|uniref:hypothetical protein n=1 Tax=Paraliobacillus sp. JSM ZJ581 TaxID=3342118 RepID=UPI0035A88261
MPEAIMIGSFVLKTSLLILVVSFVIGVIFFWFTSSIDKKEKSGYLDQVTSMLLSFILTLIGSKILLNWSLFLDDPIAVLAFPSNSTSFYIAFVGLLAYMGYTVKVKNKSFTTMSLSFFIVFLMSSFSFLIGQLLLLRMDVSLIELSVHFLLLMMWILFQAKMKEQSIVGVMIIIFGSIKLALSFFSTMFLFTFPLHSWFYFLLIVLGLLLFFIRKGRE